MRKLLLLTFFILASVFSFSQKPGPDTVYYKCTSDTSVGFYSTFWDVECGAFNWSNGSLNSVQSINYKFTIQYQLDTLCNASNIKLKRPGKYPVAEKIILREFGECKHVEFLNGVRSFGCPIIGKLGQREIHIKFH